MMSRRTAAVSLFAAATLAAAAPAAQAQLFGVTVEGERDDLTLTGNSLFDLADEAAGQEDRFSVFEGQAFTATFDYAGLQDAVVITSNADNSNVRLDIPSTGFSRTFDEADGDVGDQIEDFLREDGAGVVADFISVTNRQTLVGVTDGNPTALTAQLANESFRLFGGYANPFASHVEGSDGFRLYANGAAIDTDVGDGYMVELATTTSFRFTDRVALTLDSIGGYRNIEDSETFTVGSVIGLPIMILRGESGSQPVSWSVAPNFHIGGGGSVDQLSGGLILGGGVTNLLGLRLGDFRISSGQHVSGYGGQPISVAGYDFETEVGQTIAKGSLALTYGGEGETAYVTGGVVYTDFLDDAGVDNYLTPFAAVGLKIFGEGVFRIGYSADLGDGFTVHRGEAGIRFSL